MRHGKAFTLVELLVVVGIIGLLAAMLVPTVRVAIKIVQGTVCRTNLKNVGTGLGIYREHSDQKWPWIPKVKSDWSTVSTGTNRSLDPTDDPDDAGERSVTALMFLLVRDGQPPGLFVCPGDEEADEDKKVVWDHDDDETPSVYYWDFAGDVNVSYSWQAPVARTGGYVNGVSDEDAGSVVMADKTPAWFDDAWRPTALQEDSPPDEIRANMSRTHRAGLMINVLRADLSAAEARRPDVGFDHDNIYTASNRKQTGARDGVSLSLSEHLSPRDGFLIGPIRPAEGDDGS